jgi:hypothetical protein
VIYSFGGVDWGDGSPFEQVIPYPVGQSVTLTHPYSTAGSYVAHAYFGQQYKYQADQINGSYEACVDSNDVTVTIKP